MEEETFIMHCYWEDVFSELCELDKARLIMAIFAYVNRGELTKFPKGSGVGVAFKAIINEINRDEEWQDE